MNRFVFCWMLLIIWNFAFQNTLLCAQQLPGKDTQNPAIITGTKEERIHQLLKLSDQLIGTNLAEALENTNLAIELSTEIDADSLHDAACHSQGNIYLNLGNYTRALQSYQTALKGARERSDLYMEAVISANIGSIYYYQRDLNQALAFDSAAMAFFLKASVGEMTGQRKLRYANLLNNIGIIYDETSRFAEARDCYLRALDIGEAMKEHVLIANVYNNMGTLYGDQGNFNSALEYYKKALEIRRQNGNQFGVARSYHNLGQFFTEGQPNVDSAIYYFSKSIEVAEPIGAWQTVGSAADQLFQAYKNRGDYKRSLEALELSRKVNDSLFNQESTRKLAQLELQFDFDKRETIARAEQQKRELYQWLIVVGLVSLLVVVTLLFILQRNKTRHAELEQTHLELERNSLQNNLETRDKELAANIMYLINKNQLINQISEKLLEIKNTVPEATQPSIQKVILDLQSNINPELWQEFEFRFQQVHEKFYNSLNEQFPDLSPNERRLCAFLKLNMTTKEISAITHQNAKSIDVARTRLRKKLNLTGTDQNLVTFLAQLGGNENSVK